MSINITVTSKRLFEFVVSCCVLSEHKETRHKHTVLRLWGKIPINPKINFKHQEGSKNNQLTKLRYSQSKLLITATRADVKYHLVDVVTKETQVTGNFRTLASPHIASFN